MWRLFFLLVNVLFWMSCQQTKLKPNGVNVCSKTVTRQGYKLVQSSYVGYENYRACCGLFCWSKCQKSRPVRRNYTKMVQVKTTNTEYSCCHGWAPQNAECPIAMCNPACVNGKCVKPNTCSCNSGFDGINCENDVNECQQKSKVCDQLCQNIPGSYACSCNRGFTKVGSQAKDRACKNIDECSVSSSLCTCANPSSSCRATCQDTIGSYKCACSQGYKLAANKVCVDINECSTNHGCQHFCVNNKGKYLCSCKTGYVLDDRDKKSCLDINECSHSNGGCEQLCTNLPGSYGCACRSGFRLLYDNRTCQDVNECLVQRPCDPTRGVCLNTRGSYKCSCVKGFELANDDVICTDVDECATNLHGCDHKCSNLIGSYTCACTSGFQLAANQRTCEDIDECSSGNHFCQQICTNNIGSYKCSCRKGFVLHTDGKGCTALPCRPLPEIQQGILNCPSTYVGSICSYTCKAGFKIKGDAAHTCVAGQRWTGQVTRCVAVDCPTPYPPLNGMLLHPCRKKYGLRCVVQCNHGYSLQGTGFTECVLKKGSIQWNMKSTCEAVKICHPNPCQNGGRCYMISFYSYKCDCSGTRYIGDSCSLGIIQMSSLPTLLINETSTSLQVKAHAKREIIITPFVPNKALIFEPQDLVIRHPYTEVTFRMRAKYITGRIRVYFNISGKSSAEFLPLMSVVARVINGKFPAENRSVTMEMLTSQCHSLSITTCSNGKAVSLRSSCPWDGLETNGHLSVGTDDLKLPFSLVGYTLPRNGQLHEGKFFTPRTTVVEGLRKGIESCSTGACQDHFTQTEYEKILRRNLFIKYYLKKVKDLSPWYLDVHLAAGYDGFAVSDFQSLVYNGRVPSNMPSCPNLPEVVQGIYSMFTSKAPVDLQFMSSHFSTRGVGTSCMAINICEGIYFMSLPLTRSIDATQSLKSVGLKETEMTLSGLSISKNADVLKKCMMVYEQDSMAMKEACVSGNMWSKFSLIRVKTFFNLTFDGDVVIKVDDIDRMGLTRFDEKYSAIAEGQLELSIKIPIAGSSIIIYMSEKNGKALKTSFSSSSKLNQGDGTKMISNNKNVRFIYSTPTVTFYPSHEPKNQSDVFEIDSNYHIVGGAVIGVANQNFIRLKLSVILANINNIYALLRSENSFAMEVRSLSTLRSEMVLLVRKLISPIDYKTLLIETTSIKMKLLALQDTMDSLVMRVKADASLNQQIILRASGLIHMLRAFDVAPEPKLTPVREEFLGTRFKFHGSLCLHKLCFQHCFVTGSFSRTNPKDVSISCLIKKDQLIRPAMKIAKDTSIKIQISASVDQYEVHVPVVVSALQTQTNATLFFNRTHMSCSLQNFALRKDIHFNVTASSNIDSSTTWNSIVFSLSGKSEKESNFANLLQNDIRAFLKQNANKTQAKLKTLSLELSKTKFRLEHVEEIHRQSLRNKTQLEYDVRETKAKYLQAVVNLNRSRIQFKSYQVTSYLRNFEYYLDRQCHLKVCSETCISSPVCRLCQQSQKVNVNVLKCTNVNKKVRVTQEEEYHASCHEMQQFYRDAYTGTCIGGGDASSIQATLPNWGAGIGNVIGGPVGALVGGLAGALVGQFFIGCEDTWGKVLEKEVVTVPCKKLRLHSVEQKWTESHCFEYEEKYLTEYGAPTECNCTTQCVSTQDPGCLRENRNCHNKRKLYLERLLHSARVYNSSATEFMDNEENVENAHNDYINTQDTLSSHVRQHEKIAVTLNQILVYKKKIFSDISQLNRSSNIDYCLADRYHQNQQLFVETIRFGPIQNLEVDVRFSIDIVTNGICKTSSLDVNLLDMRVNLKQKIRNIVSQVFCSAYVSKRRFYRQLDKTSHSSDADSICNTVLKYYTFLEYSIAELRRLAEHADAKYRAITAATKKVEDKMTELSTGVKTAKTESDVKALHTRNIYLQNEIKSYESLATVEIWKQNMEAFINKLSYLESYGFQDAVKNVFEKFNDIAVLSGMDVDKFYKLLEILRTNFLLIFDDTKTLPRQSLTRHSLYLSATFQQMWTTTKFCFQTLDVRINMSSVIKVLTGEIFNLTCEATTTNKVKYYWYVNQKEIPWVNSQNLSLKITAKSEGLYRCKCQTLTKKNISNGVYLSVESKPELMEGPDDVDVLHSEIRSNYSFICNFSGNPDAQITWKYISFDRSVTHDYKKNTDEAFHVNRRNIQPGFFLCTGSNKHGSAVSREARMDVLKTCVAAQAFILSLSIPRKELSNMLNKIFYSPDAKKAWSTSRTQSISIAITHENKHLSKVDFKLKDAAVNNTKYRCVLDDRTMLTFVSGAKTNMVQLLKNVLRTLSVKTDESGTLAELRESLRSTLLLEPVVKDFCPRGYELHNSQYKCVECRAGYYELNGRCLSCKADTYQSNAGSVDCKICPSGKSTVSTGSTSLRDCVIVSSPSKRRRGPGNEVAISYQNISMNGIDKRNSLDATVYVWQMFREISTQ